MNCLTSFRTTEDLGNIRKIQILGGDLVSCSVSLREIKLVIAAKKYAKVF